MPRSILVFIFSALLGFFSSGSSAKAAIITNTISDCSGFSLAVALNSGGVIVIDCGGTLTLTNTINITRDVILDASGTNVTLSGGTSNRIFQVSPGVHFTIRNLTLISGFDGRLDTNSLPGMSGRGGAIFNDHGMVTLVNSTFSGNTVIAVDGKAGQDAPANDGKNGQDSGAGLGGAIYNDGGVLVITNTTFSGNAAMGGVGGNGGNSSQTGNGGKGGDGGAGGLALGGAIFNSQDGLVQLYDCNFFSNRVTSGTGGTGGAGSGGLGLGGRSGDVGASLGGAVYNAGGRVTIQNSSFVANIGTGADGIGGTTGVNDDNIDGRPGGRSQGGALYSSSGQVSMTNVTFYANAVMGGKGGAGAAANQAGFGGDGGNGGSGGAGNGGGICNADNGMMEVINCSFSGNTASSAVGGPGGAGSGFTGRTGRNGARGSETGGAVFNAGGTFYLKNSILNASLSGGNGGGIITDGGNNLSSDKTPVFIVPTSLNNINPGLGLLNNGGGPTLTLPLLTNSPAIDAGDNTASPLIDQRHAVRSGRSDIGAYEFNGVLPDFILSFQPQGTNALTISWPSSMLGLILEMSDKVGTNAIWFPVTNISSVVDQQNVLTIKATNQNRFYRLRKP